MSRYEIIQRLQGLNIRDAKLNLKYEATRTLESRLWEIVQYHSIHNPLYKEKLAGLTIERFEDLPIMKKSPFLKESETIVSIGF